MRKFTILVLISILFTNHTYSQWITQNMPEAKGQLQSAKMGDLLYFIGGCDQNFTVVSGVFVYNTLTNTWLMPTDISSPRCFTASIGGDSALYVAGGLKTWNNVIGSTAFDIFQNGEWTELELPDSSCFAQALHVGNKILFAGHLKRFHFGTSTLIPSDLVFVYDEITKTMSVDTLSQARTFVGAATDGTIAIFAGGSPGFNQISNVVDIYNSETDSWSTATLSQARTNLAGVYAGGKFYFAGGAGPGNNVSYNTVDIFDGTNWSTAQLCEARAGLSACTIDDKIFFIGGGDVNSASLNYNNSSSVVDIYDISQDSWSSNFMNTSKITHTAITNGTKVYVAGGISGSNVLDKIEFYDISVGINDPSFFENFTLFPNPSSNVIHFNIPKEFIGYQYSIINGLGITIFNSEINEIETNIDISQYPVGIYFLKIEGGKQPALKFIKK